jgi:ubiquinone/menaquinone biosynthesis C-methylase UbiE
MTNSNQHNPYDNADIEPKRTAILADLYDTNSIECLKPYLHEGSTVLELSPRQGSLAKEIAQLIGPKGSYTGIEPNTAHAETAKKYLEHFTNTQINCSPIMEAIDTLPKNHFDVIYFRWCLWIIPENSRVELLKKCFALLKPQGVLLAEEADMTAIKTEPALECIDQYKKNTALRCEKSNHPLTLGLEMTALFEAANPACKVAEPLHFQPQTNHASHKLLPFYGACSTKDALIDAGVDESTLNTLTEQLKTMAEDDSITLYTTENIFTASKK